MRYLRLLLLTMFPLALSAQDAVVPFTSSDLPIVVINTNGRTIVDDPKIEATMGIIDNGTARNQTTDPFNNFFGKIGIEIRGSSSQMFPKKQYGIELRDDAGEGLSASLLGMPAEEDWVLFAPYNDKSLMRDVLAYNLGRQLTGYSPRTRYCEVVLNNVYQGVYVLIEKIKRDKNRVNINKLDPDEIAGNNLTGGYIIKIDKTTGDNGDGWTSQYTPPFGTSQTIFYQYEYPKADDIAHEQSAYIQSYVRKVEDVLHGSNFADPTTGYTQYIDVDSFIDYLIIQELTKNPDAYRLSTFMYKQRDSDGGKLHMGPIWDFNLAFGNADYCDTWKEEGWAMDYNKLCPTDYWLIPFWWKKLLTSETFATKLGVRWAERRSGAFTTERILAKVDSIDAVIGEAQARNFSAWKVLGKYVWPNKYVGASHADEVTHLKLWIGQRLNWMDANMPQLILGTSENLAEPAANAMPNPFQESVSIQYSLVEAGAVEIRIFDSMGRVVNHTATGRQEPGTYSYRWAATGCGPGIYYFQVRTGAQLIGGGKLSRL